MTHNNYRVPKRPISIELQAMFRLVCDRRHCGVADAIYLFAQTEDNERSVLEAAKRALNEDAAKRVLISNSHEGAGYPGFQDWKAKLTDSGIHETLIHGVNLEAGVIHNTLTEAVALIRFTLINSYQSLYVCAPPFHQPRAFMTTIGAAIQENPSLKIHGYPGVPQPWHEIVTHSQGTLTAARSRLIESELQRIEKYIAKGDLASFENVMDYLDRRDTWPEKKTGINESA